MGCWQQAEEGKEEEEKENEGGGRGRLDEPGNDGSLTLGDLLGEGERYGRAEGAAQGGPRILEETADDRGYQADAAEHSRQAAIG